MKQDLIAGIRWIGPWLCLALSLGCDAARPPVGWTRADVVGWRYEHRADGKSHSCRFGEEGEVYCTLAKDPPPIPPPGQPPEAPVAPIFYWSIDDAGVLLVKQMPEDATPTWRWKLVSLDSTSAKVLWDSKPVTFQRKKIE